MIMHGFAICENLDLGSKYAHIVAHTLLDAASIVRLNTLHVSGTGEFNLQTEALPANGRPTTVQRVNRY